MFDAGDACTWLVFRLIPFGDLVSDIWLLSTIPRVTDFTQSQAEFRVYKIMRVFLWIGTCIDSIPELALLLGIFSGLGSFLVLLAAVKQTERSSDDMGLPHLWKTVKKSLR